jgi:hypothetical protein
MDLNDAEVKAKRKAYRTQQKAMKLATGKTVPKEMRPKSVVNNVTEYGALFNRLNQERAANGQPPLKTAMEVLIEAMQSDELDIKDKSRIADKLAPFESSRAPIISIEHVQNMQKDDEADADEALDDFLNSLRKV